MVPLATIPRTNIVLGRASRGDMRSRNMMAFSYRVKVFGSETWGTTNMNEPGNTTEPGAGVLQSTFGI